MLYNASYILSNGGFESGEEHDDANNVINITQISLIAGCKKIKELWPNITTSLIQYIEMDIGSGSTKVRMSMQGGGLKQDCGKFSYPNGHQQCLNNHDGIFHQDCREMSIRAAVEKLGQFDINCKGVNYTCTAIATAWARTADHDSIALYEKIFESETGINFVVANQYVEGVLGYHAVLNRYNKLGENFNGAVLDAGGGSLQITYPSNQNDGEFHVIFGKIGSEGMLKELCSVLGVEGPIPLDRKEDALRESRKIVEKYVKPLNHDIPQDFTTVVGVGPFLNAGIQEIILKNDFTIKDVNDFIDKCFDWECADLKVFADRSPVAYLHLIPTNFLLVKHVMEIMGIEQINLTESTSILDGISYFYANLSD